MWPREDQALGAYKGVTLHSRDKGGWKRYQLKLASQSFLRTSSIPKHNVISLPSLFSFLFSSGKSKVDYYIKKRGLLYRYDDQLYPVKW